MFFGLNNNAGGGGVIKRESPTCHITNMMQPTVRIGATTKHHKSLGGVSLLASNHHITSGVTTSGSITSTTNSHTPDTTGSGDDPIKPISNMLFNGEFCFFSFICSNQKMFILCLFLFGKQQRAHTKHRGAHRPQHRPQKVSLLEAIFLVCLYSFSQLSSCLPPLLLSLSCRWVCVCIRM